MAARKSTNSKGEKKNKSLYRCKAKKASNLSPESYVLKKKKKCFEHGTPGGARIELPLCRRPLFFMRSDTLAMVDIGKYLGSYVAVRSMDWSLSRQYSGL